MGYRCTHFRIEELVPPGVFSARGQSAWELLDAAILVSADAIRTHFGPIVINNWHDGGPLKESGLRSFTSATGAVYSQHRYGRALDLHPRNATPQEVYEYILAHPESFPHITTLEDIRYTATWIHIDCRNNPQPGIRVVIP